MEFIQKLRELSGGKPVGFKICIGDREEFIDMCKAMIETGIYPDFITVDGGEGGTGAAPHSARGMMLALGCIHALKCNTNRCPVGVATQDETLTKGLDIENKAIRVMNYRNLSLSTNQLIYSNTDFCCELVCFKSFFRFAGFTIYYISTDYKY